VKPWSSLLPPPARNSRGGATSLWRFSTAMNSFMSPEPAKLNRCPGPLAPLDSAWSRRRFLQTAGQGFGAMALAHLLARDTTGATGAGAATATPRGPDFAPRAKRCIFLFMVGGPSQMELFDPKPALDKLHGQKLP